MVFNTSCHTSISEWEERQRILGKSDCVSTFFATGTSRACSCLWYMNVRRSPI